MQDRFQISVVLDRSAVLSVGNGSTLLHHSNPGPGFAEATAVHGQEETYATGMKPIIAIGRGKTLMEAEVTS